jgi:hypothetical protein
MRRWLGLHQAQLAAKLHVVFDPSAQEPVFFAVTPPGINDTTAAKCLFPISQERPMSSTSATTISPGGLGSPQPIASSVIRLKTDAPLRDTAPRAIPPGGCVSPIR